MNQKNKNIEPVYFMDLVVENVRCFKDKQVMDLSDGKGKPARWTVILGDNGTGKTTLLKCLTFLQPVFEEFAEDGNTIEYVTPSGSSYVSKFENNYYNNSKEILNISNSNFSIGKLSNKIPIIIDGYGFDIEGFQQNAKVIGDNIIKEESIFIIAYGASRKMGIASLTETKSNDPTITLFNDNVNLINAEAWLLETDFAIKSTTGSTKKYLKNHYNKVKETLKLLLPDIENFRIKKITKTNRQAAIEVKTPYGWVDMKNLSHGYQTFIAWVVDLAARLFDRYPDSKNSLEEPCIVLVDEIDLHLHPKWQRKIIQFLTDIFKNAQFIVTAHSPLYFYSL